MTISQALPSIDSYSALVVGHQSKIGTGESRTKGGKAAVGIRSWRIRVENRDGSATKSYKKGFQFLNEQDGV